MPEPKNKSKNNIIIALLAVLIIAVLCVGGYFIIKDLTEKNTPVNENNPPSKTEQSQSTPNTPTTPTDSTPTETTPTDTSTQSNLNAGITYAERRGNDFYIEAQVEGAVNGTCTIYLIPSNGSETHVDTDDLDIHNKVSLCDEDFSLKGNSAGQHTVRVVIEAFDGRSTTLEKIVNID